MRRAIRSYVNDLRTRSKLGDYGFDTTGPRNERGPMPCPDLPTSATTAPAITDRRLEALQRPVLGRPTPGEQRELARYHKSAANSYAAVGDAALSQPSGPSRSSSNRCSRRYSM